jgi:ribosome-interacting GTPase 1
MRVTLLERWNAGEEPGDDPFSIRLPALLVANKSDLETDGGADLETFRDLTGLRFPALAASAATGAGIDTIGPWLFEHLGIVRIYTKAPGHAAEKARPFTIRRGETVGHVARLIHQDLERTFKYARVWGRSGFDGQHVGHDHVLSDGDVLELHA